MAEKKMKNKAEDVFDRWALDYHADGMESSHWKAVKEAFKLIPESDGNYLEIGVGNGYGIACMADNQYQTGQCTGIDISANMVERTRERTSGHQNVFIEKADFMKWKPPGQKKFSCIFSMEVFYYFENVQSAVNKAAELLVSEGMLMVLVNHYFENEASHDWADQLQTHMTLWNQEQYRKAFEEAGLGRIQQKLISVSEKPGTLCTYGYRL